MSNLTCDIITPERPLFSGECAGAVAPASDGMVGILPDHAPMLADLGGGTVELTRPDGTVERVAVNRGFLQVIDNKVTVLAVRAAQQGDATDDGELRAEAARIDEALKQPQSLDVLGALMADRDYAQARLDLAQRS